jgi:hypothetical protein
MIVKLNRDSDKNQYGQLVIPIIDYEADKGAEASTPTGFVRLMPGYNNVPDEKWNIIKKELRDKMEKGLIELQGKKGKDAEGNEIIEGCPLRDINVVTALKIVKDCFNIDTLKEWLENTEGRRETRDEIRLEIKNQIAMIESGGSPKDE